ncbi:MAG: hypothetical protein IPH54_20260 [Rhodoferax sp.]|nr:hypothetical protein [Rhodoferax sp.]
MASPMVSALKKLDQALDPSDTPKRLSCLFSKQICLYRTYFMRKQLLFS